MPRIAATNIEEHVRQQNARITEAARKLFAKYGFAATDMGQIASSVGLARNSLYRYFPNKDHILLACIREDMQPYLESLAVMEADFPDPRERIMVWVDTQFAMATGPAHATMELIADVRDSSVKLGREVRELHQAPNRLLAEALQQMGFGDSERGTLTALIGGMVLAATAHALPLPEQRRTEVLKELRRAIEPMLAPR
jgi:AcrR family transcriptional regulator